ncbi:hypothetical protein [Methyloraptor flagellatus]|uniref:Uncharacterized protein n=1 Tax=Methyloraptor flagellatus TaxID=3162530 RepID=A0AAU7XAX0_9HYPH
MQHICGCWSYDREANCLINVITEEKIHYRDRLEWHKSRAVSQIHRLVYVSGKTEAPIFVSYDLEREYPEKDQDPSYAVTYSTHIYTVDFSLTIEAMDTNATTLPFGLWQRLCEAAPQALLFWPERWPHTEDDSGGPDLSRPNTDQSRKVVLVGAWRNARWVPDGRSIHECDTRATPEERAADFYLLPREHWDLPAPNAPPPPALQFNVPRADKLASLKLENWPDEAAAFQYLRDHGVLLPEPWWRPREARPEAWSIEDIPHCRSETDFRFFAFLDHLQFKNGHGRNVVLYDFAGATSMGGFFSSTELVAQHIDKSLDSIFRINNQKNTGSTRFIERTPSMSLDSTPLTDL